jgi:hypothetical protein
VFAGHDRGAQSSLRLTRPANSTPSILSPGPPTSLIKLINRRPASRIDDADALGLPRQAPISHHRYRYRAGRMKLAVGGSGIAPRLQFIRSHGPK